MERARSKVLDDKCSMVEIVGEGKDSLGIVVGHLPPLDSGQEITDENYFGEREEDKLV